MLKRKILENRELLIKVKEMKIDQARHAEQQMLSALKDTVHQMEDIKEQAKGDSASADNVLKSLERMEEIRIKMEEKDKMVEMLAEIDIARLLNGMEKQESNPTSGEGKSKQSEPGKKPT